MSLDNLILKLKCLKIGDLFEFPYLNKPSEDNITSSIENLKILGCIDGNEKITQIGKILSKIHIDPFLSRSIIQAIAVMRYF